MKKSISGFCSALGFFLTSAAFAGGLSEGLLLHYPFDRDEGPVLTDACGSGRFGWAHGATWVVDGANGGGFRFDSNRQYIVADDAGLPRGDAPRTMALWIKLDKLAPDPVTALLTYGQGSWNHMSGIGMDWRVGRANLYFTQHGGVALSKWRMEKPGAWHHLAYVYGGKGQHWFYVDGQRGDGMSELRGPIDTQLSGAVIVGADPTGTGPAGGVLDDVRIYGRALSEKEIAELAQGDQPNGDADTDGDGYSDALEIARGSDPLDPESVPKAATFYVDASRPDDTGDAASWATAKQTIQAGVDLAVLEGDVVLVNDGVYETGTRVTPGCQLQNRVLITNEITVRSVNGPEATMIQGQGPRGTNAVRCAYMTAGNLIGFTLANGHTRMEGDGNGDQNGGGLSVSVSNRVVVSNCVFRGNSAYNAGGAIFGTFYNCVMEGNSAARAGGAVCCGTLYNCKISGNSATYYGGAADQCHFYNCTITDNSAMSGGGVYHCMLYNSIVVSNRPANAEWVTCLYSCVDPLQAGEGNMAEDPQLLSGGHLASDSPCVGAGSADYAFGTDLDGEAWRNPPSIGCDEVPLLADLLVHYTFDRDEGGIVTDDSGNGRTAKVDEATWVKDGARGGAYRFDSNSEAITATDAGLPSGDAPRSIALWMKIDTNYPGGCTGMLGYGTDGFDYRFNGLGFDWRLDRNRVYFTPGGACFLTERQLPEPGTWIHIAYTYGGNGDHHLYVDGVPSDGMSELWGPVNTTLSGLLLLGGHPNGTGPDGGYVDDVRIYGRVLSAEEIAALAVPDPSQEPQDLLVHYTFDQDEGGIVTDDSGNGRTAQVNGATWIADGARGGAYRFENYSQNIAATDAGLPAGDSPRTMALWMKIDNCQTDRCSSMCVYGTKAYDQFCSLGFDWRVGRNHFSYTQWGSSFLTADRLSAPGTWMHVAYAYAGNGEHHLFFNGKPSDGMSELGGGVNTTLSGLLKLGTENLDLGPTYVDDVRIYGRVLSEKEIAELAVGTAGNSETNLNEEIEFRTIGNGAAGALTVQWACEPGVAYDLYWTDDLTKGFSLIASGLVSDGTEMSYTNALAVERTGFYRVALHK